MIFPHLELQIVMQKVQLNNEKVKIKKLKNKIEFEFRSQSFLKQQGKIDGWMFEISIREKKWS